MTPTDLAYRKTAADGASGFGLLVALFDTLAGDIRRAAQAQRQNDIERRCREIRHALDVIAHLENWVSAGPGGELAQGLLLFYQRLRKTLIQAQAKQSSEILEQQMADVLTVRELWQQNDTKLAPLTPEYMSTAGQHNPGYLGAQSGIGHSGWSA